MLLYVSYYAWMVSFFVSLHHFFLLYKNSICLLHIRFEIVWIYCCHPMYADNIFATLYFIYYYFSFVCLPWPSHAFFRLYASIYALDFWNGHTILEHKYYLHIRIMLSYKWNLKWTMNWLLSVVGAFCGQIELKWFFIWLIIINRPSVLFFSWFIRFEIRLFH